MKVHFKEGQEIVFFDKPAGVPTHAPDKGKLGVHEWLSRRLDRKLWVVHRLDKTTTGSLAFATSAARAEALRAAFESHSVRKRYWFLTDRTSEKAELEVASHIDRRAGHFVSDPASPANARTRLKRIKRTPFFELWQAEPETGKPHQVRLHAADAGLPILGDIDYGGSPFPHLCLHAQMLGLPDEDEWTTPPPRFFERMGLLKDPELVRILASIDRRQRVFDFLNHRDSALRLIHNEHPDYRLDKLGPTLWLHWYRSEPPNDRDLERWEFVKTLLRSPLVIQMRQDRGADPNTRTLWEIGEPAAEWTAREEGLLFEFRQNQGLSAGLFLDQRLNRAKFRGIAHGKSVLNLFAYTGGFSLAAAAGGAAKVTTVDLSAKFLDWARANFRANGLDPESHEWSAADSFLYLNGAIKRGRRWDLIVCDPPSFSRSGKKVFRLKEDLESLAALCRETLAPGGVLLFSCNIESMGAEEVERKLARVFPRARIEAGEVDWDFELPQEEKSLKAFWIRS